MRAEDLKLEELVDFQDGRLNLHGRRLLIHALHALAQFRKDLIDMTGAVVARRILTRFGYIHGHADAAAMKRIFEWRSLAEWIKAGPRMHSLQGMARAVVRSLKLDEAAGRIEMEVTWHDSGEAEEHAIEFGQAHEPVCWMLVGYASGYASFCMGRDVYFVEQTCSAAGARVCSAIGKDRDSWGPEIVPYLPYFRAEDIQGKISKLTQELKEKTKELSEKRRRLRELESARAQPLVEVRSESFRRAMDLAGRIAPYDTTVLITGESGAGKEVMARHIHANSRRGQAPFVAVNCGALPETLLESELFGHKAGAFTGAFEDRVGLFEQASKGTILLDEIGEVSPAMQVKLLRVLQEREVMRVGESKTRKVDARVLAATNRDLKQDITAGRFREDLYYRLGVIEIAVPPLRDRRDDILPLARMFVEKFSQRLGIPGLRLHATCVNYLQAYNWPGNVRELENVIERASVLSREGQILPECLPPHILHGVPRAPGSNPLTLTLSQIEEDHIRAVVEACGGNRSKAAKTLAISPATLWRKLKAYGM